MNTSTSNPAIPLIEPQSGKDQEQKTADENEKLPESNVPKVIKQYYPVEEQEEKAPEPKIPAPIARTDTQKRTPDFKPGEQQQIRFKKKTQKQKGPKQAEMIVRTSRLALQF